MPSSTSFQRIQHRPAQSRHAHSQGAGYPELWISGCHYVLIFLPQRSNASSPHHIAPVQRPAAQAERGCSQFPYAMVHTLTSKFPVREQDELPQSRSSGVAALPALAPGVMKPALHDRSPPFARPPESLAPGVGAHRRHDAGLQIDASRDAPVVAVRLIHIP